MSRSFSTSLNEGEQHVKITYCHHVLCGIPFSNNIRNFILPWSYDGTNVSTIHSSNGTFKMWLKSITFPNFTWNLFKLTIGWLYNISRKRNQRFQNLSKFSTYCFSRMLKFRLNVTIGVTMHTSPKKHGQCLFRTHCPC